MALIKRKKQSSPVLENEQLNELVDNSSKEPGDETEIDLDKTSLSFHPDWEISNQEKYVYMYFGCFRNGRSEFATGYRALPCRHPAEDELPGKADRCNGEACL